MMTHFGISGYAPLVLYGLAVVVFFASVWRPVIGLYYIVPLLPLQTVRYWMQDFPLGKSVVDIILLGVMLGLLRRKDWKPPKTGLNLFLLIYGAYFFISLCFGSFYLDVSLPFSIADPRFAAWKNATITPMVLFFLALLAVKNLRQMKFLLALMCFSVLLLNRNVYEMESERDHSEFSEESREEGALGYVGSNGLAAFEAQFAAVLVALYAFERRIIVKCAYLFLAVLSLYCLVYSFSRGGYVALLLGWLFFGLVKIRKLLPALLIFVFTWEIVVPPAVRQRVLMTYAPSGDLEPAAQTRITLWEDALRLFHENPLIGVGVNTYAYLGRVKRYNDTHNFYLKILVESGVLGLLLFLALLTKMYGLGYKLFRRANDPFLASLGLGLCGWIICALGANLFGDRWSYLQISGYLWVLLALVVRGLMVTEQLEQSSVTKEITAPNLIASQAQAVA